MPRELAQCVNPRVGQVSQCCTAPIDGACMNVRCATLLSNGLVGTACGQAQSSDPRGRACKPNGKRLGEEGILSDVVPILFIYTARLLVSMFL